MRLPSCTEEQADGRNAGEEAVSRLSVPELCAQVAKCRPGVRVLDRCLFQLALPALQRGTPQASFDARSYCGREKSEPLSSWSSALKVEIKIHQAVTVLLGRGNFAS